jgi:hypothetical protein
MKTTFNNRPVYMELDSNRDGSRFIDTAYYLDGEMEFLTDIEVDALQEEDDDIINDHHWT